VRLPGAGEAGPPSALAEARLRLLTLFRIPFALAVLVALGGAVAGYWVLVVLAVAVAAAIFILGRDPIRDVPSHPLGIVSPVDGRVASVEHVDDPFLPREALHVRLHQGVLAPAVVCSPTEGRVQQIWGGPEMPGYAGGNRLGVHLRTDEGDDVIFVIGRAHGLPGPLSWRVQPGERVGQGQHRGLAGWGRPVSVYIPERSKAAVESGQRVHAGADLVCQLVHAA
jgi:phosphatidylserine decarboxylase